ncbi:MAG: argininosuccinate lyase [Candidatus Methanomethyliaceae archaeon]|nr:argininosuccinate lyase [Candidatus Methanomethyliaceae archaeon]
MKITRGGRLSGDLAPEVADFTSSSKHDIYIADEVVEINLAHLLCLVQAGIITREDGRLLARALKEIKISAIPPDMEDVHMVVESELIKRVGEEIGGKIHTGKSRNDQVAAALRMRLRRFIIEICGCLIELQNALLKKGEVYIDTVMPGYTHLQHAQPISVSHHMLAYFDMFDRHLARLLSCYKRVNLSPMGSAALAGTGYPIDRVKLAEYLGFEGLVENTLDAVSTRDFSLETVAALSIMMVDVSRIAEELVIWASNEFGYVDLPDDHSSTSSIMPQKKNPVTAEVLRAKCGDVLGDLVSMVVIMKSLPLAYNLDMQELTPHLWNACEISKRSLKILADLITKIRFNEARLKSSVVKGSSVATELADTLVRNLGLPFRAAHRIVGEITKELFPASLSEVPPEKIAELIYKKTGKMLDIRLIQSATDPAFNINVRSTTGGPASREVERMISTRRELLKKNKQYVEGLTAKLSDKSVLLNSLIDSL